MDGLGDIRGVGSQNYRNHESLVEFNGSGIEALGEEERRLIFIKMLANSVTRDTLSVHGTEWEL